MAALERILTVVGPDFRKRFFWVVLLAIGVGILEFVSIGGMFPLLTLMFNPSAAKSSGGVWQIFKWLHLTPGDPTSIVWLAVVVLALLFLKVVTTAYSFRAGYRFTMDAQVDISRRMLERLFARDYEYFLGRNSTVLLKNVTTEVQTVAGGVLIPAISIITQLFVVLFIGILLAWISPVSAAIVFGLIGGLTAVLYLVSNKRLLRWGKLREQRLGEMHNVVHQSLLGIKTVKTHASEDAFLSQFNFIGRHYADLNAGYQTAAAVPPLLIEFILFGGMTTLMLYFAWRGANILAILPLMGLIAAAAFRLLPAARRIYTDSVTVRYYWSALEVVEAELRSLDALDDEPQRPRQPTVLRDLTFEHSLRFDGVSYGYPQGGLVLQNITLDVPARSKLAIVGSSGAGKSTMIDIVLGLLNPTRGRLLVDGVDVDDGTRASWVQHIGYVSQQIFLVDGTVRDNVAFGVASDKIDDARLRTALAQAHLLKFVDGLPDGLDTRVGENGVRLSGGERQRLGIARALYRQPRLLVLDEATSALDSITEYAVNRDVLAECADLTVIIVAHRLSTIRDCDRIVLLDNGRIAATGTYEKVLAESPLFAEMHKQSRSSEAHPAPAFG